MKNTQTNVISQQEHKKISFKVFPRGKISQHVKRFLLQWRRPDYDLGLLKYLQFIASQVISGIEEIRYSHPQLAKMLELSERQIINIENDLVAYGFIEKIDNGYFDDCLTKPRTIKLSAFFISQYMIRILSSLIPALSNLPHKFSSCVSYDFTLKKIVIGQSFKPSFEAKFYHVKSLFDFEDQTHKKTIQEWSETPELWGVDVGTS